MAEIFEVKGEKIWIPNGPPMRLLPPEVNVMTMNEIVDLAPDEYRRIYYERSGRFLGIFETKEEADQADPYRYARKYIPGGKLPWEK
jgi:hypothetical protein